ncbi:MAG: hypothetical protein JNL32_15865, partial [Candidatus Kapabacteria bacterium]|nr:hypothetical protein [Candidatus Kapabacteria bacterium]
RIAALDCTLRFAAPVAESDKTILEHIAHTCPVKQSLSGDIDIRLTFIYPDGQSV